MKQFETEQQYRDALTAQHLRYRENCPDSMIALLSFDLLDADRLLRTVRFGIKTAPWMQNQNHVVHGGITATILDDVMGILVRAWSDDGKRLPTVELHTHFILPIAIPAPLQVRARIVRYGGTLTFVEAEAFEANTPDRIAATASATFYTKG